MKFEEILFNNYNHYYDYNNIHIDINCVEVDNTLIMIFIGSGIGWFMISNKMLLFIKKYCCKKYRNNIDLIMAEHIV